MAQHPERYPGLLETSAPIGTRTACGSRFDILPISCGQCLRLDAAGRLSGPHAHGAEGFLAALELWWKALRLPETSAPLPYTGGWLLYLGYELAAEIEPRLKLPPCPDSVIALAVRAPAAWIRDRISGEDWVTVEPGYEALLQAFYDDVDALRARPAAPCLDAPVSLPLGASASLPPGDRCKAIEEDPAKFVDGVTRSLEYIAAGDVYQVNLSRQWRCCADAALALDPVSIYQRLRCANPSPFAGMIRHGGFAVMSSSPERLLAIRRGVISTRPIAGTRPRGDSPEADAASMASLLSDEKERAEHVMLIDLERNDLGKVCVGGTVRVDEYMVAETYAHVHHIVSNLSGRLREDVSPIGAIRALFPGGTITGCPKIRCMEIIAELEAAGRGAYTGSLGYLNRDGSCDLNILIRTLTAESSEIAPGNAGLKFRAGAGIVADSVAGRELAETRAKAEGLLRAMAWTA